ncbi:MAG: ABC transporter permease subunit [Planctomycetota bacterium]
MSQSPGLNTEARTSPGALGVMPQWIMAFALSICIVMIFGLLTLVLVQGISSFWPTRIESVKLSSGEEILGIPVRTTHDEDGSRQTLFRVGNRDLGASPFRWVADADIASRSPPDDAILLERQEWGIFIGRIAPGDAAESSSDVPASAAALQSEVAAGRERREAMERLRGGPLAQTNRELREVSQAIEAADLRLADGGGGGMPRAAWISCLVGGLTASVMGTVLAVRRSSRFVVLIAAGALPLLAAWLEMPGPTDDSLQQWHNERVSALGSRYSAAADRFEALNEALEQLQREDQQFRVAIASSGGVLAPESQSNPDELLRSSQIIRAVQLNTLSVPERVGVFAARWRDYLLADPREANTEGGIFPVIVGTVTVTLLLTVVVVPLGVLAALYIREYAKQGVLISILRVAINNLAGVPSIVYGIFGLGFFCYVVGGYIDGGPEPALTLGRAAWWIVLLGTASAVVSAALFRSSVRLAGVLWAVGATAVLVLFATSPYFDGFFRVKLLDGEPTFGSSGLLWASLTLALLTLPVVIVSTEEAIAAVPQSLREASYGCGASRWQTVSRVVLPGAMPGVMTGTILAMARGAGEVAPLMVVGAVKLAPDLPVESRFPFVFADRSFMHMGFHIFDLGFQSPDSEAARGMVWTTTLLLIVLVITMNLAAIALRGRLRRRLAGGHF